MVLHPAPDVPADLAHEVRTDLATELGRRGLSVCEDGESLAEPAAIVRLSLHEREASIELDDRTTQKRVARDVRLDRVPPAGRALALAIAIDELLRASWAELTMHEHAPEREPPPPPKPKPAPHQEPSEAPEAQHRPAKQRRARVGALLGYMHSWQDLDAFTVEAEGELVLGKYGFVGLSVGPLLALPVDAGLGTVSTYGATGKLRAGVCLPLGASLEGCLGARAAVEYLHFAGDAKQDAQALSGSSWLVHADGLAGLALSVAERMRVRAELALGAPLHGVRASDGDQTLVGATGVLLSGQLGLQVSL